MANRTALLLGATGLVGGHTLDLLVHDPTWTRIVTLGRRAMEPVAPHHEHHIVDFARLGAEADRLACDDLAICLGTTIKQAGSQAAFRHVDLELPMQVAEWARDRGATRVALVSAYGADRDSRIFYNRVKGEVEDALQNVGFESTTILRPSLLDGDREEVRIGERVGLAVLRPLAPLLIGPLRPLRPTSARDVAASLVSSLRDGRRGTEILEPVAIQARARSF